MDTSISPIELRRNIHISTFMEVILKLKTTIRSNRKDFSDHFNLNWKEDESVNFVTVDDRICEIGTCYEKYHIKIREVIEWYFTREDRS